MAEPLDGLGLPSWPAAERNKQPIVEVLQRLLPSAGGTLLEVASGTGQHAAHFARHLAAWTVQPSDCDPEHLAVLERRAVLEGLPNLRAPVVLDVTQDTVPPLLTDAIYCANMLHIAPWNASLGLFRVAAALLRSGQPLVTYGPYNFAGTFTSESNRQFDASLRERNADWGVRDVDELSPVAEAAGFSLEQTIAMPANNFILSWRRH
jgi:SAM-dependent methyltransferase